MRMSEWNVCALFHDGFRKNETQYRGADIQVGLVVAQCNAASTPSRTGTSKSNSVQTLIHVKLKSRHRHECKLN